jgi:hypothetical protein
MEVTQEMISSWKEKHNFVYRVAFDGKDYYFKTLTRNDYITIQQKVASSGPTFDNEFEVAKTCILYPVLTDEELQSKAGLVSVLSERIMLRSGFQQVEEEEL